MTLWLWLDSYMSLITKSWQDLCSLQIRKFNLGYKTKKEINDSHCPSTRAWVVSGTGLGRAAFHCYPVLKIGIGCILFSQSERRWRRRAAYNGDNGVPFLFQVSEIWNFFNSRWCQVSIKIVLIVLLIFCHLLFILVWPVIALVRSIQCSFGPGNFLKLLVALRVPIEILWLSK